MKNVACAVLIFTMIIFLVNPLSTDAGSYYGAGGHGSGGYSGYRGGGSGWWLPWAIVGGTVVLVSNYLSPYYARPPVVIREQPPVYVQPAPSGPPSSAESVFVYARQGQREELQANARYECHRWAVSQTRYDPTHFTNGMPPARLNQVRSDYQRAMSACLEVHETVAIDYHEEDTPLYLPTDTTR